MDNGHIERTAIVFGGGGSRGAFALGVAKYLRDRGESSDAFQFDMVIGNSCGALVAAIYYGDLFDDATDAFLSMRKRDVVRFNLMRFLLGKGLYDPSPLRHLIDQHIPEQRLHDGHRPLVVVATDVKTGRLVVLSNQERYGDMQSSLYHSAVAPILCAPQESEGLFLADGGYRTILPLQVALKMGATRIMAISVSPSDFATLETPPRGPLQLTGRWIELLCGQNERNQIQLAREKLDGVSPTSLRDSRVKLILPQGMSMPDPPNFNPDEACRLYAAGQEMATAALGEVETPWEAECYSFYED